MIERISTPGKDILAYEAVGKLTKEDYKTVLQPQFEKAYNEGRTLRFLYLFGDRFEGFSAGAAWEDFKVGLQYLRLFRRCAVVTDNSWISNATSFFGSLLPLGVRVFPVKELTDAMDWLATDEVPLDYHLDTEKGVLTVELVKPLTVEDFEALAHAVDPFIAEDKKLNGIVIHGKKFPGWENLGGLIEHIRFVGGHHRKVRRVAVSADGLAAEIAPLLAKHFVEAEIRHFPFDELSSAQNWVSQ